MIPTAPLRSGMAALTAACVAGGVVVGGLVAGWYDWRLFVLAGVVGLVVGIPLGIWIAFMMRVQPPLAQPESPTTDPDAARRAVDPGRREPYPPADDQTYAPGEPVRSGM
ncbi:MAG: hypothetical protein ACK4GT_13545 [Pararhodobacter sp.]